MPYPKWIENDRTFEHCEDFIKRNLHLCAKEHRAHLLRRPRLMVQALGDDDWRFIYRNRLSNLSNLRANCYIFKDCVTRIDVNRLNTILVASKQTRQRSKVKKVPTPTAAASPVKAPVDITSATSPVEALVDTTAAASPAVAYNAADPSTVIESLRNENAMLVQTVKHLRQLHAAQIEVKQEQITKLNAMMQCIRLEFTVRLDKLQSIMQSELLSSQRVANARLETEKVRGKQALSEQELEFLKALWYMRENGS